MKVLTPALSLAAAAALPAGGGGTEFRRLDGRVPGEFRLEDLRDVRTPEVEEVLAAPREDR